MEAISQQPKHTQGEWKMLDNEAKLIPQFGFYEQRIQPPSPSPVITARGKTKEICEANAERIVKAVNMHDELISCLEDFISTKGLDYEKVKQLLKQSEQK